MTKKRRKKTKSARDRWHTKLKNASRPMKLVGRKGTVQGAFWKALCPVEKTAPEQISAHIAKFNWLEAGPACVYCGRLATDWDHLMPLRDNPTQSVTDGITFTGFGSLLSNLVPACQSCNQSKGFADWQTWLAGTSDHAIIAKSLGGHEERSARLVELETEARLGAQRRYNSSEHTLWVEYNKVLKDIQDLLVRADQLAESIRAEAHQTQE